MYKRQTLELTGYSREEILSKSFLEIIHPDDRKKVYTYYTKRLKGENVPQKYDFRIVDKYGNIKWVEIKPIMLQWKEKPAVLAFIDDITERKKSEEEIKRAYEKLEEIVKERTVELEDINKRLKTERERRKEKERDIEESRELLQNILDSSDVMMISVDLNGIITAWNKLSEQITGYKTEEAVGRKLVDINLFKKPYSVDDLKKISVIPQNSPIQTKNGKKKMILFKVLPLENSMGVLIIGKDITHNIELHGKLIPGYSYLVLDETVDKAIEMINNICITEERRGLILTRGNPNRIKEITCRRNIDAYLLSETSVDDLPNISRLEDLKEIIIDFITKYDKTIILLDRIDYLVNIFSFQDLIETLYHVSPMISTRDAILLVRVNPSSLQNYEVSCLQEELKPLPYQRIEEIHLDKELFEILVFIEKQTSKNIIVSYQDISNKFNISRVTTGKRIQFLINRGLVEVKIEGRRKLLYPTISGRKIIENRRKK